MPACQHAQSYGSQHLTRTTLAPGDNLFLTPIVLNIKEWQILKSSLHCIIVIYLRALMVQYQDEIE